MRNEILNDEHKKQAEDARRIAEEQKRQREEEAQKRAAAEQFEREQKGYKLLDETAARVAEEQRKAQAIDTANDQLFRNSYDVTHGPFGVGSRVEPPMEVMGPDLDPTPQQAAARQMGDFQYTPMGTVYTQHRSAGRGLEGQEASSENEQVQDKGRSEESAASQSIGEEISERARKARDLMEADVRSENVEFAKGEMTERRLRAQGSEKVSEKEKTEREFTEWRQRRAADRGNLDRDLDGRDRD